MKNSFSHLILLLAATFLLSAKAYADTGIGFAWDTDASTEVAYDVNLSTGVGTAIGTLPGLEFVLTGSHSVDYPTGITMLIGSKGMEKAETLFMVVPTTRLIYSFKITGLTADQSLQRALLRSSDGAVYVLISDRAQPGLLLKKVTFDAKNATASLDPVTTINVSAFNLDGVRIGDDKNIYILSATDTSNSLVVTSTESGASTETTLDDSSHSGLFLCNQTTAAPRLFGFAINRDPVVSANLVEIAADGHESSLLPGLTFDYLAGTLTCDNNTLRLIGGSGGDSGNSGGSGSGSGMLAWGWALESLSLAAPDAGFQPVMLSPQNVKFVGVTRAKTGASSTALSTKTAPSFTLLSQSAVKKCAVQLGKKNPLPKSKSKTLRAIAKALNRIKRVKSKCALR